MLGRLGSPVGASRGVGLQVGPKGVPGRRRWPILAVAACAVLLAGAARASAAATLGVAFSSSNEPGELAEEWRVIGKSGAGLGRLDVSTTRTPEIAPFVWDWSYYDRFFGAAAEGGVTILPILSGRFSGAGGVPSAGEREKWIAWAKQAVRRYGYNGVFWSSNPGIPARPVIAWEMWNEPNNGSFGSISASEYGTFLAWAGPAVQAASESWGGQKTGVLFGGLLSWSGGINYQTYLKNAYAVPGASSAFTGLSFHPYTVAVAENQQKINITKNAIVGARNYLDELAGCKNCKSLWITEFGWPTKGTYAVTEGAQANMLQQTVGWMKAEAANLNLHSIVWYADRDTDFIDSWQSYSGLRDEVGNFRESWFAFQQEAGAPRWPLPRVAMQANTGNLFVWTKGSGAIDTLLGMSPKTTPSVGQYRGSYEVALHANTGTLFTWTPGGGGVNTGLGMAAGTSPSITPLLGGHIAFQGSTGTLWTYDPASGGADTGIKMAPNTSPAITVLPASVWRHPARYAIAFQGSNGNLMFTTGSGALDTGLGMAPGTSPAIAARDRNGPEFTVLFQANTGAMWIYEPGGTVASTGLGMQAKTSPAVASLPNGSWTGSFQANTGEMWLYNPGGTVASTGLGMQAESSPSVIGLGDTPYFRPATIALNVNTGQTWTYEAGGAIVNTLLGSNPATGPTIGPG
jgi:hypothetical protein